MSYIANKYTGNAENYTPGVYIEAARRVLGVIDLDPASNVIAQETIRAKRFFTKQDDGLRQEWSGCVFLNPPYSRGVINQFVDKLVAEYHAAQVTAAILLTNAFTDTKWFHTTAESADVFCCPKGRIRFYKPDGKTVHPHRGQTFFYFGPSPALFAKEFGRFGFCLWHPRYEKRGIHQVRPDSRSCV